MGTMHGNRIGLAGELRVMSELLLRGYNPAKSYLESGPDIVLENGFKIEVKSGHRCYGKRSSYYNLTLKGGGRKRQQDLGDCDFIICWCISDDCFFIIPKVEIAGVCITISNISDKSRNKYMPYKDRWNLLGGKG